MTEFANDFLPLLRCSSGGGPLSSSEIRSGHIGIIQARLEYDECGLAYRIEDGIARTLLEDALSPEHRHEIAIRDVEYVSTHTKAVGRLQKAPTAFEPYGERNRNKRNRKWSRS
jgi:uncharacterized protein YbaR (Trm112 family)